MVMAGLSETDTAPMWRARLRVCFSRVLLLFELHQLPLLLLYGLLHLPGHFWG